MTDKEDMIKLVLARLNAMPDNIQIHLGNSEKALDKNDLIRHVKDQDPLGKKFVSLQMAYIKATIAGFQT